MTAPFGLSVIDVVEGIKFACTIYDRCFTKEANFQYIDFVKYIGTLSSSLVNLRDVVNNLDARHGNWRGSPNAQRGKPGRDFLPSSIGDFSQTLDQCHALLEQHVYLKNGRPSPLHNLKWWMKDTTVNNLKAKLKMHIDMINLYLKPDELASAIRNERQIDEMRQKLENLERKLGGSESLQSLWSIVLSEELKEKFEEGLATKRPSWLPLESDWPLDEGFQAFAFHFDNGTVNISPPLEGENRASFLCHLNLAKAIFVLTKLKEVSYLRIVGTESIWSHRMRDAEDMVKAQVYRVEKHELDIPPASSLLSQHSAMYWLHETESEAGEIIDASVARFGEAKILDVGLLSDGKKGQLSLLVFREGMGDTDYRLVKLARQPDGTVAHILDSTDVYMDRDRLIALYAIPDQLPSPRHNLLLLNDRGKRSKEFAFKNAQDLGKLQQALTGYRLHHSVSLKSWRINGLSHLGDTGRGSIQLWQYKPLDSMPGSVEAAGTGTGSSDGNSSLPLSPMSSRRVSKASTPGSPTSSFGHDNLWDTDMPHGPGVANRFPKISQNAKGPFRLSSFLSKSGTKRSNRQSSIATTLSTATSSSRGTVISPVKGNRSHGVELSRHEMPVLVIFTVWDNRYRILQVTLNPEIHVEKSACECRDPAALCDRVIFESSAQKMLFLRKLRALEAVRDTESSEFDSVWAEKQAKADGRDRKRKEMGKRDMNPDVGGLGRAGLQSSVPMKEESNAQRIG